MDRGYGYGCSEEKSPSRSGIHAAPMMLLQGLLTKNVPLRRTEAAASCQGAAGYNDCEATIGEGRNHQLLNEPDFIKVFMKIDLSHTQVISLLNTETVR